MPSIGDPLNDRSSGTAIVVARYRVAEYGNWLERFSSQNPQRALAGAAGHSISVSLDDPRRVEAVVEFVSLESARRYEEFLLLPSTRDGDRHDGVVEHGAVWVAIRSEHRAYADHTATDDA